MAVLCALLSFGELLNNSRLCWILEAIVTFSHESAWCTNEIDTNCPRVTEILHMTGTAYVAADVQPPLKLS